MYKSETQSDAGSCLKKYRHSCDLAAIFIYTFVISLPHTFYQSFNTYDL